MSHYFNSPDSAGAPTRVDMTLGDRRVELLTDRGVFSRGGLDVGTKVLLDAVPPPPERGNLLDLGCGYGPIAIAMAFASPAATVWAVDVNDRARELCERNRLDLRVENVRVCAPDGVPEDLSLSCIWSNPPIRIGRDPLRKMLAMWLDRLDSDGVAHLVVQRHLGADSLQEWLTATGWPTTRVLSRKGFRVLRVTARPQPHHGHGSR